MKEEYFLTCRRKLRNYGGEKMRITIHGEVLTASSFVPFSASGLLHTENSNGIVKIFHWGIRGCKLLVRYNKNSVSEIEYIEAQLKSWEDGKLSKKKSVEVLKNGE